MSYADTPGPSEMSDGGAIATMTATANRMQGWLKFIGIVMIIGGALTAITIVGIIYAWLPIWMGILLFQAGDRAQQASISNDWRYLNAMLDKLRLFAMIYGIAMIVVLGLMIIFLIFFGAFFEEILRNMPTDVY